MTYFGNNSARSSNRASIGAHAHYRTTGNVQQLPPELNGCLQMQF